MVSLSETSDCEVAELAAAPAAATPKADIASSSVGATAPRASQKATHRVTCSMSALHFQQCFSASFVGKKSQMLMHRTPSFQQGAEVLFGIILQGKSLALSCFPVCIVCSATMIITILFLLQSSHYHIVTISQHVLRMFRCALLRRQSADASLGRRSMAQRVLLGTPHSSQCKCICKWNSHSISRANTQEKS